MARIQIYLDDNIAKELKNKSILENLSISEISKIAICEYLNKDVNLQMAELSCIEDIRHKIKSMDKEFNLFYSLFYSYLKYWFADCNLKFPVESLEIDSSRLNEIIKNDILKIGDKKLKIFISYFKQNSKEYFDALPTIAADSNLNSTDD